jgi:hypothetical protein
MNRKADRYLLFVRRRGEDGALRKVGAIAADLRTWRRDADFRERERAAAAGEGRRDARVINPYEFLDAEQQLQLARGYLDERFPTDRLGFLRNERQ